MTQQSPLPTDSYPGEMKTYVHTKIYTQMFTAALFITAINWKQSKCPLISDNGKLLSNKKRINLQYIQYLR